MKRTIACLLLSVLVPSPIASLSLQQDSEFAEGSWVPSFEPSPTQVESLAALGKVWGFLKYHHPLITSGELHWDHELFGILPEVLDAADATERNETLVAWVERVGLPEPCDPCAQDVTKRDGVHLTPELDWIVDERALGAELVGLLGKLHADRSTGAQHHLSQVPNVGNPVFDNEPDYAHLGHPDAGYRVLALFRFWNIIEYWFPYRDLIEEDWDDVLRELLPRFVAAEEPDAYRLAFLALIARVHDTHANLWSSLDVQPPRGVCNLPVTFRFVEERAVVTGYSHATAGPASGLEPGDVVTAIDGTTVNELVETWSPYYPASNVPTRLRDVARAMGRGPCKEVRLTVLRDGAAREVVVARLPASELSVKRTHDRDGETYQELSDEVAYIKLSSIRRQDVAGYVERAQGKRGLVVDIRNYPAEFVVFELGQRLIAERRDFARFTAGDFDNPGAFLMTGPLPLRPAEPRFGGKVVILVDEVSQSQAEYTAMALRVGPDAIVVGSTTAGADGNVSSIPLPGGLRTMISGIGVFYPDGSPTQRVGIVPDLEVRPTIAGIRARRDEPLEVALREILGPDADGQEIQRLAARP